MSKERARRRAEREAARAAAEAKRARLDARRARWRRLTRTLRVPRRRSAWGLGRRSPGQRAAVTGVAVAFVLLIWYFVESFPVRIALTLLVLLALPVLAVVSFDRKGIKL